MAISPRDCFLISSFSEYVIPVRFSRAVGSLKAPNTGGTHGKGLTTPTHLLLLLRFLPIDVLGSNFDKPP